MSIPEKPTELVRFENTVTRYVSIAAAKRIVRFGMPGPQRVSAALLPTGEDLCLTVTAGGEKATLPLPRTMEEVESFAALAWRSVEDSLYEPLSAASAEQSAILGVRFALYVGIDEAVHKVVFYMSEVLEELTKPYSPRAGGEYNAEGEPGQGITQSAVAAVPDLPELSEQLRHSCEAAPTRVPLTAHDDRGFVRPDLNTGSATCNGNAGPGQTDGPKYPDVMVDLSLGKGNAYATLGAVTMALRRAGVGDEEVALFVKESTASDYDNMLRTATRWTTVLGL